VYRHGYTFANYITSLPFPQQQFTEKLDSLPQKIKENQNEVLKINSLALDKKDKG
jgi:hypothetical protein